MYEKYCEKEDSERRAGQTCEGPKGTKNAKYQKRTYAMILTRHKDLNGDQMISEIYKSANAKATILLSHVQNPPSQKVLDEDPGLCHMRLWSPT